MNQKRVVYFAPDLSGGGAERVMVEYIRNADRARIQPILIVCKQSGRYAHLIPKDVPIFTLEKNSRYDFPLLVLRFRKLVKILNPDFVVSFLWYADLIQLMSFTRSFKSVCSIHAVAEELAGSRLGKMKLAILKRAYPLADQILVLSDSNRRAFQQVFKGVSPDRIIVQPNPFNFKEIRSLAERPLAPEREDSFIITTVGRLSQVKGQHRLLEALAEVRTNRQWQLNIVGEGPLKESLQSRAVQLGIESQVHFIGFVDNPYPYIKSADLLVMTSHFEAFPNVLIEALALGTAAISTDCPHGPRDILGDGRGILVPNLGDPASLTSAIENMIDDDSARRKLESQGPAAVAHLESTCVAADLEQILESMTLPDCAAEERN